MILVTGATGFVARALIPVLTAAGHEVTGAVRTAPANGAMPGCHHLVAVGDIDGETHWTPYLDRVDVVVHLAARVHVMRETVTDPLTAFRRTNVEGTRLLAEQASAAGVKRFVFLSSAKVNGEVTEAGKGQFSEADAPHPEDAYGVSKLEAEQVLWETGQRTGIEVVIIRSPLIYGTGVKANFLSLIQLIDSGIPLPFGSIRNQRSLLSLTNLVDLIIQCLDHPSATMEMFLASDGDDVSTPELVRRIARALGKPARLLPIPEWIMKVGGAVAGKSNHVKRLCGSLRIDSSKARRVLGWAPACSMAEELTRVAAWYNAIPGIGN